MIFLAHAGLSDFTEEDVRNLWWGLLLLASLIPAFVTAVVRWSEPKILVLAALQAAVFVFILRAIFQWARRRFRSEMAVSAVISVAYFPACLISNLVWLLGLILIFRLL